MSQSVASPFDLTQFDYPLPEQLIARHPLPNRSDSKLLKLDCNANSFTDGTFTDILDFLNAGDVLVVNNAKVLPVRLLGNRVGFTGQVEVFLLAPQNEHQTIWHALLRPAKKLPVGTVIEIIPSHSTCSVKLLVTIVERLDEGVGVVELVWDSELTSFEQMLSQLGHTPLPPYLGRQDTDEDQHQYQTVYAKTPGAQAAPTAGLHFTPQLLESIKAKGVLVEEVTLFVSAGTFKPVVSSDIRGHNMMPERYQLTTQVAESVNYAKAKGNKVVAVGTTSMKTLETVAQKFPDALQADEGSSELFIYPGFDFKVVDALITNFHLPQSTLLMLVSAFANRELILRAYNHAIENNYRFYSYGDAMLIS